MERARQFRKRGKRKLFAIENKPNLESRKPATKRNSHIALAVYIYKEEATAPTLLNNGRNNTCINISPEDGGVLMY